MNTKFVFPYSFVSEINFNTAATAKISVAVYSNDILVAEETATTTAKAKTWNQQDVPIGTVDIDVPSDILINVSLVANINVEINGENIFVVMLNPKLVTDAPFDTGFLLIDQYVNGIEITPANQDQDFFKNKKNWINLLLDNSKTAKANLKTILRDNLQSVLPQLADKINFKRDTTHVIKPANKAGMSIEDNIEYYLGKDKVKNLFFEESIPSAWDIPARQLSKFTFSKRNVTVVGFYAGDTIKYYYNNLGYRSNFDFVYEELKNKQLIVCLGDSDAFGAGVEYNQIWPTLLQEKFDKDVVVLNFGVAGISNDGLTRIGARVINTFKENIKSVCIHYAPLSLRELVSKNYKGGIHTHRNYNLPYDDWWKHIDWQSNNYNLIKNKLLLEGLCSQYKADYIDLYINKNDVKVPYDAIEYGVYTSIGPLTHQAIANYFYKRINKQPSLFESLQS